MSVYGCSHGYGRTDGRGNVVDVSKCVHIRCRKGGLGGWMVIEHGSWGGLGSWVRDVAIFYYFSYSDFVHTICKDVGRGGEDGYDMVRRRFVVTGTGCGNVLLL